MSFFVILSRSLEILVKPLIAHISDEIKTKMGRRKPFMLIGCGFYALFLIMLFSPPSVNTTSKALSIWYGIFFVLFFMAESVTIPPYLALAPEYHITQRREKNYIIFFMCFNI
jgi:GPH family glycoside/pentoside/hexuronide:cation symporter